MFLAKPDMKYELEAVALQTLLSANGVPTATMSANVTKDSSKEAKYCNNRPLYIFVTSGPSVQGYLKQVNTKLHEW
jgi:hypothetical protein